MRWRQQTEGGSRANEQSTQAYERECVVVQPDGVGLSIALEEKEVQRRQQLREQGYSEAEAATPPGERVPGPQMAQRGGPQQAQPQQRHTVEHERLAQRRKRRSFIVWLSLDFAYYLVLVVLVALHLQRVGCCDNSQQGKPIAGNPMLQVLGPVNAPVQLSIAVLAIHLLIDIAAAVATYRSVPFVLLLFICFKTAATAFEIFHTFAAVMVIRIFCLCTASQVCFCIRMWFIIFASSLLIGSHCW